ncbi:hypothetical protein Tco_0213232 [Tanacetum coccineum]
MMFFSILPGLPSWLREIEFGHLINSPVPGTYLKGSVSDSKTEKLYAKVFKVRVLVKASRFLVILYPADSIIMDPSKVEAITKMVPDTTTVTDVRSFLGLLAITDVLLRFSPHSFKTYPAEERKGEKLFVDE